MNFHRPSCFQIVAVMLAWAPSALLAQVECEAVRRDVQIAKTEASGSFWDHVLWRERSAKVQASRLVTSGLEQLDNAVPAAGLCTEMCAPEPSPELLFKSAPEYLSADSENIAYCAELRRRTEKTPLIFPSRAFEGANEIISWFEDFSRGEGEDGENLYSRCDRDCTPRYTVSIRKKNGKLYAGTSVVCGEPRDKDRSTFVLETLYRYTCLRR